MKNPKLIGSKLPMKVLTIKIENPVPPAVVNRCSGARICPIKAIHLMLADEALPAHELRCRPWHKTPDQVTVHRRPLGLASGVRRFCWPQTTCWRPTGGTGPLIKSASRNSRRTARFTTPGARGRLVDPRAGEGRCTAQPPPSTADVVT